MNHPGLIHDPGLTHSEHLLGFSFGRQTCRKMGRRWETLGRSSLRACSVLRSTTGLTRLERTCVCPAVPCCSVVSFLYYFWAKSSPLNLSNKNRCPRLSMATGHLSVACAVVCVGSDLSPVAFCSGCLLGACCLKWVVFVVIFVSCSLLSLFGAFFLCWFDVDCLVLPRVGC